MWPDTSGSGRFGRQSAIHGAVAQLGERLHGMQEVVGSIPIGSTLKTPDASPGFFGFAPSRLPLRHLSTFRDLINR